MVAKVCQPGLLIGQRRSDGYRTLTDGPGGGWIQLRAGHLARKRRRRCAPEMICRARLLPKEGFAQARPDRNGAALQAA